MQSPPEVKCRRCDGSGHEPLDADLFEVLQAVLKAGSVSAGDPSGNGHGPITHFQLEKLRALGLVKRTKNKRKFVYRET